MQHITPAPPWLTGIARREHLGADEIDHPLPARSDPRFATGRRERRCSRQARRQRCPRKLNVVNNGFVLLEARPEVSSTLPRGSIRSRGSIISPQVAGGITQESHS